MGNQVRSYFAASQQTRTIRIRFQHFHETFLRWDTILCILCQAPLSLLCVKKFSGSATMLEAPPGSREDLVEAARTPCTPTGPTERLYAISAVPIAVGPFITGY
ncbi:hypothetical protein EAI_12329 [Harpegnathos saltator]|uniref:Uncharacterized protein n=1 Tax=Harpegnathos saltator TaxID=610380 RepID=E2BR33_HARSA|nr:hypothetical protein EAI_12329 [Harpegnathos saltator]